MKRSSFFLFYFSAARLLYRHRPRQSYPALGRDSKFQPRVCTGPTLNVHLLSNGEKMPGLCDNREIGIRVGVKDKAGQWVPYGFDFGSAANILPGQSALFPFRSASSRKIISSSLIMLSKT